MPATGGREGTSVVARRLVGFVTVESAGDEWEVRGEEETARQVTVQAVLRNEQARAALLLPGLPWGCACFIHLWLTARALRSGLVQVEGKAILYRRNGPAMGEPEDEQAIAFSVPQGRTAAEHRVRLCTPADRQNQAEIGMSFFNIPAH